MKDDNLEAQHQADTGISYLTYCASIEQGGDEGSGKRELSDSEEEARESALSCIMLYFEKAFLQIHAPPNATNRKYSMIPDKKRAKKKSR